MADGNKSCVEHVAIKVKVKDIDWHIRLFRDALSMEARKIVAPEGKPKKVWTIGGMQFDEDPDFNGPEGRMDHLGIMVDNLDKVLADASQWGVRELPAGRNWLALPDGLGPELMQAHGNAVAEALAINPR